MLGVVSALLAGLSIIPPLSAQGTVVNSDGSTCDAWRSPWLLALLYTSFIAFMCNIAVIITSTLLYIYIDHIFTPQHLHQFIADFMLVMLGLPIVFAASVLLVVVEVLVVVGYTARLRHFWILMSFAAFVSALLSGFAALLAIWTGIKAANLNIRAAEGAAAEATPAAGGKGTGHIAPAAVAEAKFGEGPDKLPKPGS